MAGRGNQQPAGEAAEITWERVWASQTSKILVLAPPYLVGIIVYGLGAAFHLAWGRHEAIAPWAAIGESVATMILTGVTWGISHHRGDWGRIHTTATTFLTGMWVTVASIAGVTQPVVAYLAAIGGLTVAVSWNIRTVIRNWAHESGIQDPLAFLFDRSKSKAKLGDASMKTIEAGERKIEAKMQLPPGEKTVEDVQKKVEYIEGAQGLPPGTMTVTADLDRADRANVTYSDPRIIRNPVPWPGPSRPGASIALPLRPGIWQDLEDVEYIIVGHHIQVMGASGSGKSIGCSWDTLAEIFTRRDPIVLAIDIVKGEQTLGPMRRSLHRMAITEADAIELITELQARLKKRTDYLARKKLFKWREGCGLSYIVLWIEEAWKLFEIVDMDTFEELMKALRSAGGTVVYSLQRGDSTQVPTLVKGQAAYWCFGVTSSHDARWGLSEAQDEAGARPELWGTDHPGMSYLHAPSTPKERIAMPMRTWAWGLREGADHLDDELAVRQMEEHCARWPAADKPVDHITAPLVRLPDGQQPKVLQAEPRPGTPAVAEPETGTTDVPGGDDLELVVVAAELVVGGQYVSRQMIGRKLRIGHEQAGRIMAALRRHEVIGPDRGDEGRCEVLAGPDELERVTQALRADDGASRVPDPDPSINAGLDDPIEDDPDDADFTFRRPDRPATKMSPEESDRALLEQIQAWRAEGRERFATRDMRPLMERTGMSRRTVQRRLGELLKQGELSYDDQAQQFLIRALVEAGS